MCHFLPPYPPSLPPPQYLLENFIILGVSGALPHPGRELPPQHHRGVSGDIGGVRGRGLRLVLVGVGRFHGKRGQSAGRFLRLPPPGVFRCRHADR